MMTDEEHREWTKARALERQRRRREQIHRIDFYPSRRAWAIVRNELAAGRPTASYQTILNRIIEEWANSWETD